MSTWLGVNVIMTPMKPPLQAGSAPPPSAVWTWPRDPRPPQCTHEGKLIVVGGSRLDRWGGKWQTERDAAVLLTDAGVLSLAAAGRRAEKAVLLTRGRRLWRFGRPIFLPIS